MFLQRLTLIIILAGLIAPMSYGQEASEIDWHKVKIDCSRRKRKSKHRIDYDQGQESREQITITTTIKNDMKKAVSGLQLHVYLIGETSSTSRKNRKPVQVADKLTKNISVEPYKKVVFEAIKSTLSEKREWRTYNNGTTSDRIRVSGETYEGYIALLQDSNGKLLVVKAENTKIKRIAQDLKIIPKEIELDRNGLVAAPPPVKK